MRLWVAVALGKTKVNNVNNVAPSTKTHKKVIRLNVSMDKTLAVDVLNSQQSLVSNH